MDDNISQKEKSALILYNICPIKKFSREFLYRTGLIRMSNIEYKSKHIDIERKNKDMSIPLAWSLVIPFFFSIFNSNKSKEDEFLIKTMHILISQYGLIEDKYMGKLLITHNVINIPIENLTKEFYYAVHILFLYKNDFLKKFIEEHQHRFTGSKNFIYWRALYFVLSKYYSDSFDNTKNISLLANELILNKSNWYSVKYVQGVDTQEKSEEVMINILGSMYYNILASFQINFLRTDLERAEDLIPKENINYIV